MFVSTRQGKKTVMKRFVVRTGLEPVADHSAFTLPPPDLPRIL